MAEAEKAEPVQLTLTVPEAGKRLGLGRNASYAAAKRGELPVLRFGKRLVVPIAALQRKLEARSG
jgi:excisionase family DNA binding protein